MTHDEVPAELVEKADLALADHCARKHEPGESDAGCGCPPDDEMRVIIAAVLPDIQAQALREAAGDMHRRWSQDDDGPAAWLEVRAARLTATTERPTDG